MEAMDAESDDLLPDSPGDLVDYELKALLDIEREIMSGDDDDDDMHGVSPSDNDPMQLGKFSSGSQGSYILLGSQLYKCIPRSILIWFSLS